MCFEYQSSYIIVIPTGNKKKTEVCKWGGNSSLFFWSLPPFPPMSILAVIILSIRSEEILLFLVLLIQYP